MRRRAAIITIVLTLTTACGGDDDSGADTTVAGSTPATPAVPATTGAPEATAAAPTTGAPGTSTAGTGGGGESGLTIADFAFPQDLTVAAGEPIQVVNEDDADHTVTAADGAFDLEVAGGATEELVIAEPGTYEYACSIHPNMTATIVVE